jgi:choline dehydrogenase-like flavoprotein
MNLTLLRDALVLRLVINRGRARGVDYLAAGRIERAEADGEIICAAGAIGSPHLMMLSGLGPAAHLAEHGIAVVADLPGVGQDLQDHMGGCPVSATLRHPERFGTPVRDFAAAVQEFEATGSGLLATHYTDAGAFLRLDPADPDPDFEAIFIPGLAEFYRTDGAPERTRVYLGGFERRHFAGEVPCRGVEALRVLQRRAHRTSAHVVLQVLAHAGQVRDDGDALLRQMRGRA